MMMMRAMPVKLPMPMATEVSDEDDNCANVFNPGQSDRDEDGPGDVCDNCPDEASFNQADADEDGIGDACEEVDFDGDGIPNLWITVLESQMIRRMVMKMASVMSVMVSRQSNADQGDVDGDRCRRCLRRGSGSDRGDPRMACR